MMNPDLFYPYILFYSDIDILLFIGCLGIPLSFSHKLEDRKLIEYQQWAEDYPGNY